MRSIWMKLSLALALLGTVPLALAAGFDCAKAKVAAEQKICADPRLSELDTQMTQAFEQARAKAGPQVDALVRDQRNWLGERDDIVMSNGSGYGAIFYQRRIMFLERVFDAPPTDAPLLTAIVKHLASQPSGAPLSLGGDGTVFKWALRQPFDSKRLPFDIDPQSLTDMTSLACIEPSDATLFLLDGFQLGGFYSSSFYSSEIGSNSCAFVVLFGWHGRTMQPIVMPETLGDVGITREVPGGLVEFHNHAYVLSSEESSIASSDIEAQQWDGKHGAWTDPVRVLVRYDYRTAQQYMHCAQASCAELTALARKALDRYVRNRDVDTLAGQASTDGRAWFETMRQQAENDKSVQKLPWADMPDGYVNRGDHYGDYREFDRTSVFFPVLWQGEWLLGRMGRATYMSVPSHAWLLGIWRWDGHAFVPMFGMAAPIQRTGFLVAAWLPSRAAQLHCEATGECTDSSVHQAASNSPAASASK